MISVSTFKTKITPKLHGTSLAKISDVFNKMHEAAGNMYLRAKAPSLVRSARIENAIYDRIYNYAVNADLDPDSVIDIRPVGERATNDDLIGTFSKEFDIKKKQNTFHIEYVNGQRTLRLSKNLTPRTTLHRMDSLTLEGPVTLGGDASNGTIDTLDYISGNGSMAFDLSGVTGTATILMALPNGIDLSDMRNLGALFEWLKISDVSRLTSVKLEWGSSDSVYWHKTVTAAHDRTFANAGNNAWMLLRHDWSSASTQGSPVEADSEAIDHLKITITYSTGTALTAKLDNITAALGEAWEVLYYSSYFFTDAAGTTYKEIPTADTDIIRLDGDGINIFMYEFMLTLQQEIKGKNMAADFTYFRNQLEGTPKRQGLYELFADKYPDQSLVRSTEYYHFGSLDGSNGDVEGDPPE